MPVIACDDIMNGVPVIEGTRVPAYDVAAAANAGLSIEEVLAIWPSIDSDSVAEAVAYATTHPKADERISLSPLPPGAIIIPIAECVDRSPVRTRQRHHGGSDESGSLSMIAIG